MATSNIEMRYNKDNFLILLAERKDTDKEIFLLKSEVKKLNGKIAGLGAEITMLKQKPKSKENTPPQTNSPWNKIVKLQKGQI